MIEESSAQLSFCRVCGSALWVWEYPKESLADWHQRLGLEK